MNKLHKIIVPFCIGASIASISHAASDTVTATERKAVERAVQKISDNVDKKVPLTNVTRSPVPGILQVTSDLNIFYVTADGQYAFFGDLINVAQDKKEWSVTERAMRKLRVQALASIDPKDMIIFPATAPKIGSVTVFTDLDCGYCRKMHENIKEYTDAGIEIRYLSFPRAGEKSKSFEEAVKVWCAKDKAAAFTKAIDSREYPKDTCKNNTVLQQFELGQQMGVNGTPTMFLDNGAKIGGLVEPKTLAKIVKEENKS